MGAISRDLCDELTILVHNLQGEDVVFDYYDWDEIFTILTELNGALQSGNFDVIKRLTTGLQSFQIVTEALARAVPMQTIEDRNKTGTKAPAKVRELLNQTVSTLVKVPGQLIRVKTG